MASVREVYNALGDLANKEQRGFITPAEFNSFAPIAQQIIFNKLFEELTLHQNMRRRNVDPGRDKSRIKQVKEDLNVFAKQVSISKASGVFAKPDDFARMISMKTFGDVLLDVTSSVMTRFTMKKNLIAFFSAIFLSLPPIVQWLLLRMILRSSPRA